MRVWFMRIMAPLFLCIVLVGALMGARTDRRLTGGYFNSTFHLQADTSRTAVIYMSATAKGDTSAVANRKMARWWSFANGPNLACSLAVYSPSVPSFNGDFTDTASTNKFWIKLGPGETWNSEGMPIYGYQFVDGAAGSGMALIVIARD